MMTTTWTDLRITRAKTLGGLKTGETKTVWKDSNANRCCNMWAVSHASRRTHEKLVLISNDNSLSYTISMVHGTSTTPLVGAVLTT